MSRATRPIQAIDAQGNVIPYSQNDSKVRVVYATSTIRYYGIARPNADVTAEAWRVYRETVNSSDNTTQIDFAGGSNYYNHIWDDSEAVAISAITQAADGEVTTSSAHGLTTGDIVNIEDVVGMTECNDSYFTITVVSTTKFTLGVNTTGYGAYSSGGKVYKRTFANYSFS